MGEFSKKNPDSWKKLCIMQNYEALLTSVFFIFTFRPHHTILPEIISLFRQLAELSLDGKVLTSFSHRELKEPVSVAVSPTSGHWVVADIGARAVLVFEPSGRLVSFICL